MIKIICFIDKKENYCGELEECIVKLDNDGYMIYLYTDVILRDGEPADVLYNLDVIKDDETEEDKYIFLSNMYNLTQFVYRVYHQAFDSFIYFEQEQADQYPLKDVYKDVLNLSITDSEGFNKLIYTNASLFKINNYNCEIADLSLLENFGDNSLITQEKVKKIFCIKGTYYLFEPFITDRYIIIGDEDGMKSYPGFHKINYMYPYDNYIVDLITLLNHINSQSIPNCFEMLEQIENKMKKCHTFIYNMNCAILDDISIQYTGVNIIHSVLLLSFLARITKKAYFLNRLLDYGIENDVISFESRYYLWNQAKRLLFTNTVSSDSDTEELMEKLYKKAYYEYKAKLIKELIPIPNEERDQDTIVVFTIQFLGERHAPTRTTLERCYTFAKNLGKRVMLINTKEQYTGNGIMPFYQWSMGSVINEYNELACYRYKECEISYYQPDLDMPSIEGIKNIIQKVRQLKPFMIFSIGTGSITADLCGNIVPQAALNLVFSSLPTTMATFSVVGRNLTDSEWKNLFRKGYKRDNIIESTFTFDLIPKRNTFTRRQFNIPEDKFILVTVGIRLDKDIDDSFIQAILPTFRWGTHMVFAGYFGRYTYFCEKYSELKEHSTYVGYCDDVLALMEICDLYVNPKRLGGGFSITEAFHEGKPGVTLDYGDVATVAGKDFIVKDYNEMTEIVKKYMVDKKFYKIMSEKAVAREKIVTDSVSALKDIIGKIQDSSLFF